MLRLADFLARSTANGPGVRSVVWVQGCARACPGCFNPEMQDPEAGELVSEDDLVARIRAAGSEGVTFSGGEPFDQAPALARIASALRDDGLSVICYSGFTLEELLASRAEGVGTLLAACDVLVDGPFVEALQVASALGGSSNQRVIPLTGRYSTAELTDAPVAELAFDSGSVIASGVDHEDVIARIRERLAAEHGVTL